MDALRNVQITSTECDLLTEVRNILSETDIDLEHTQSLAAGMARTWSWLLRDVSFSFLSPCLPPRLELFAIQEGKKRHKISFKL